MYNRKEGIRSAMGNCSRETEGMHLGSLKQLWIKHKFRCVDSGFGLNLLIICIFGF